MKKILGLDLGTNSIGWALLQEDDNEVITSIIDSGSRIIDSDLASNFEKGKPASATAERRKARSARRLLQRKRMRRERLIRTLKLLGWIPTDYEATDGNKIKVPENILNSRIKEMKDFFGKSDSEKINEDLIVYFLKYKGLSEQLCKEELAMILYHYAMKRGFKSSRKEQQKTDEQPEETEENNTDTVETKFVTIQSIVNDGTPAKNESNITPFLMTLSDGTTGRFYTKDKPNWEGKEIELNIIRKNQKKGVFTMFTLPKKTEIKIGKFLKITETQTQKNYKVFECNFQLQDGLILTGNLFKKAKPEWENIDMEIEIKTETNKDGEHKFSFKQVVNNEENSTKRREALEQYLEANNLHVSESFLLKMKENFAFRIKDNLVYRKRYKSELEAIWNKQIELNPNLLNIDSQLIEKIALDLYKSNKERQYALKKKGLFYILAEDIIYYQRPLKSQIHGIAECRFEKKYIETKDKGKIAIPCKVIPVSAPLYQEFRIWQFINNLKIDNSFKKDCTEMLLTKEAKQLLFEKLDTTKEIKDPKLIIKALNLKPTEYSINFRPGQKITGNATKASIRNALKNYNFEMLADNDDLLNKIWHILYSVVEDEHVKKSLVKLLKNHPFVAGNFKIADDILLKIADKLKNITYKNEYGSMSAMAIKKILPLMRAGKYFDHTKINPSVVERIADIRDGVADSKILEATRKEIINQRLDKIQDFQGLQYWLASSIVYGSHSENLDIKPYKHWQRIKPLKHNSLRNPVVEQILNEMLQLVKAIWKLHGRPDDIRVELARELKNSAAERSSINSAITKSMVDNDNIVAMMKELGLGRHDSLNDIEKLKLWKETASNETIKECDEFFRKPSKSLFDKYKLWLEAKFVSPYTGQPIPLSKLFSNEYQIEHIIPKTRFFDDSMMNKTICESEINKEKGALTAYEYIKAGSAKFKLLSLENFEKHIQNTFKRGKANLRFLAKEIPEDFVERQKKDTQYIAKKAVELLSKVAKNKVSTTSGGITDFLRQQWGVGDVIKNIVKERFLALEEKYKDRGVKFVEEVVEENGKRKTIIKEYSKRLDHRHHALDAIVIAATSTAYINNINKLHTNFQDLIKNLKSNPKFQDFINKYKINFNQSFHLILADLQQYPEFSELMKQHTASLYKPALPCKNFNVMVVNAIENIVVSFKNRTRIVSKTINHYKYKAFGKNKQKAGTFVIRKALHKQTIYGERHVNHYKMELATEAIKHIDKIADKNTKIALQELLAKMNNNVEFAAKELKKNPVNTDNKVVVREISSSMASSRKSLIASGPSDKGMGRKELYKMIDREMANQLLMHLINCIDDEKKQEWERFKPLLNNKINIDFILERERPYNELTTEIKLELSECMKWIDKNTNPKEAFSAEEIEKFNANRKIPVHKVTVIEDMGEKYALGDKPNLVHKFVETAKGANLYFVIYVNIENPQKRLYESINYYQAVQAAVAGNSYIETKPGYKYFTLSPNDLVYVPDVDEDVVNTNFSDIKSIAKKIYKMVSYTGKRSFFIPYNISKPIENDFVKEFGSIGKIELLNNGKSIKDCCIKLNIDRLGKISPLFV